MNKQIVGKTFVLAAMLGLACLASTAMAHHSFAMFDKNQRLEDGGAIVQKFHWANPHVFVVVDVTKAGKTTRYTLECNSINAMMKAGWRANTLKPGDKVDVSYYPLRNGEPGGMLMSITLPDGRELSAW